jgi:protein-tyrosine phosphatase
LPHASPLSPQTVLFLCTGNYYRSRFAEILFNALARERQLSWHAASRGLAIELGVYNVGPLSAAVAERLHELGLSSQEYLRMPLQVSAADLEQADLIVALKEAEHRPLLMSRHPEWEERVEYWHIHDTDLAPPAEALQEIEQLVRDLVARLQPR